MCRLSMRPLACTTTPERVRVPVLALPAYALATFSSLWTSTTIIGTTHWQHVMVRNLLTSSSSSSSTGRFPALCCISNRCLNRAAMTRAVLCTVTQHISCWALRATAIDYLIMNVDGFNATQAAAAYPPVTDMDMEEFALSNLGVIRSLIPARIQGQLFTHHPQLLEVDMQAWVDFLQSFGLQDQQLADILRSSPELFYSSNIYQAGQLLLFLRHNLQLPDDALLARLKWAAVLRPSSSQASMQAVTQALQQHLPLTDEQVLPALSLFPDVLGWDVQDELLPRLAFFESLGPAGKQLLDTMHDAETGYLQGLRSWQYAVAPKLQLLAGVLGSEQQAAALLASCPSVLKLPVESKLQPVLGCLAAAGVRGEQMAQLLRECPKLLAEPRESIVARINFLVDVIGGDVNDLMAFPQYAMLPLADAIGPRYYFLARQGWLEAFSEPSSGTLQLARVMQPELKAFLADVAQAYGEELSSVAAVYGELRVEWDNMLGWCCDKAFSSQEGDAQGSSMYEEQLNLFYVLVQ